MEGPKRCIEGQQTGLEGVAMGDFDREMGIKGTPTTILNDRAPKAMVGRFSVKGVSCN